ncbi:hypothetical protein RintRC_3551 [Richelia intracellularis]|nr:hypothetical protein RintRC_3551 [Richelia intracellularis]
MFYCALSILQVYDDLKNGKRRGKQNHICVNYERQFIDIYNP